jgi:hypothetical protein
MLKNADISNYLVHVKCHFFGQEQFREVTHIRSELYLNYRVCDKSLPILKHGYRHFAFQQVLINPILSRRLFNKVYFLTKH